MRGTSQFRRLSRHGLRAAIGVRKAFAVAVILGATAALAPAARAQHVGTYIGTNNEGDQVEVAVAEVNGGLAVTGMSDSGAVYCRGTQVSSYGVDVGLAGQPITNGQATVQVSVINLYFGSDLTFSGNKVKGTIVFVVPVLTGTLEPPKKACAATSGKQHFEATLSDDAVLAVSPRTASAVPISR